MTHNPEIEQKPSEREQIGQTISTKPHYNFQAGKPTPGEKLFDTSLYLGLGYAVNLAGSIALTEFMLHGKGKTAIWDPTEKILVNGFKKMGLSHETALSSSKVTQEFTWLTSGGTILMIPIKLIEDRKSKLVYLLNRTFFPNTIAEDDPYRTLSSSQILNGKFDENCLPQPEKEQPKNSWLNTGLRRLLGFGLVVGFGNAVNMTYGKERYENNFSNLINNSVKASGSKKLAKAFEEPRTQRFALWTIVDGINTIITSATTYLTNGAKTETEEEKRDKLNIPAHPSDCLPAVAAARSETHAEPVPEQEPKTMMTPTSVQMNGFSKQVERAFEPHEHHKKHHHDALKLSDEHGYAHAIKQHQASDSASLSV